MIKNVLIVGALIFGVWLGIMIQGEPEVVEVPFEVKRDVYNLSDLQNGRVSKEDLEKALNFLNWSHYKYPNLQAIKDALKDGEQKLEDIKRRDKQELEDILRQADKSLHLEYGRGYDDGYRDTMQKK